jgi:carnitine O-palmitoyltransferase 1, liver isoform
VFVSWNTPSLYSFQGSLPHLPLPSIEDTVQKYLKSVRPLLKDENYEKTVEQSKEFERGIGKKLQRYLVLKSWWSQNYVSDWWEEYVYLGNRDSLMCGSNYYGSDLIEIQPIKQTARAASLIYLMLQFRRRIERQELKPIMAQGLVPLCSWQYERMFNTVRVPGTVGDKIVHYNDIKHIVVHHKGCYYKMIIYHKTRLLSACEIQYQLDLIVNEGEKYLAWSLGERNLASLTSLNRTKWAEIREKFFSEGINKVSLEEIESSAFLVALDDEPFTFGFESSPQEYGYYGQQLLHGKGNDRWFDKSFQLCVGTNGRVSF